MGKRKVVEPVDGSVESFVEEAFSDAEQLKDELQEWYDNLPEPFQNGQKGDDLQEAISALESANQPDVPDLAGELNSRYTPSGKRKQSRADRLGECVSRMEAAAQTVRDRIDQLEALEYDEDTERLLVDGNPAPADYEGEDPLTESDRDSLRDELDTFASECDDAASEWGNVTFPGMFG